MKPIRFGVQTWPQDTTWPDLRDTWRLVEQVGYDTAWTFDHFVSMPPDSSGPCLGVLVSGNTYRQPAVLAKIGATLDHTRGETAEIITRLWTEREVTLEGRYYRLGAACCEPKPIQKPRPPRAPH